MQSTMQTDVLDIWQIYGCSTALLFPKGKKRYCKRKSKFCVSFVCLVALLACAFRRFAIRVAFENCFVRLLSLKLQHNAKTEEKKTTETNRICFNEYSCNEISLKRRREKSKSAKKSDRQLQRKQSNKVNNNIIW